MENAVDALKMAGAVLIFVLALSIVLLFFSQVRATSDLIIEYRDRENFDIFTKNYYASSITATPPPTKNVVYNGVNIGICLYPTQPTRLVGIETMLQAITRSYIENYKILIYDQSNNEIVLYNLSYPDSSPELEINYFDLEANRDEDNRMTNVVLSNEEDKIIFLKGILYGNFSGMSQTDFEKRYSVNVSVGSFFDRYKNNQFYEFFGVYYQNDNENIPDIMKYEKRIITYKLK